MGDVTPFLLKTDVGALPRKIQRLVWGKNEASAQEECE